MTTWTPIIADGDDDELAGGDDVASISGDFQVNFRYCCRCHFHQLPFHRLNQLKLLALFYLHTK